MQFFGVGILELMVIMTLAVIVIGPDRMPAFAADLAKWIRQARAYANHLTKDFNDVVSELEKEAGATREDWKEIASVVGLHTGAIGSELQKLSSTIDTVGSNIDAPKPAEASNVVPFESPARPLNEPPSIDPPSTDDAETPVLDEPAPVEDKPWYVPERTARRRSAD